MSIHWKEKFDSNLHIDYMSTYHVGGSTINESDLAFDKNILFVKECSFVFQFINMNQLNEMIEFISLKIHKSTRREIGLNHWWHSWQERMPKGLLKGKKKDKILKALIKAKEDFEKQYN